MSAPTERGGGRGALIVGFAALALCAVGAFFDRAQFFRSWLIGFVFWAGISLGSMGILMLHHLSAGRWGRMIRRELEAAARTTPLLALFFAVLLFGLKDLYPWARPAAVAADRLLAAKRAYLNLGFFAMRGFLFLALWSWLGLSISRWRAEREASGDRSLTRKIQGWSAPGIILYGATTFFASIDWIMSLTPKWYSSIFGLAFLVGQGLSAMAFSILWLRFRETSPADDPREPAPILRDLGNFLFMFLMLWAYMAFSQLIIIWSANLPEEVVWYLPRLQSGWKFVTLALFLFYFAAPFALLLSRRIKENLRLVSTVAGAVLFFRLIDLIWQVEPAFSPARVRLHWMDLAAPLAIGGFWIAGFRRELAGRPSTSVDVDRFSEERQHG